MAIGDDTAIDYTNQIISLTGTTIYDVSVLYSYCKEQFKLSANIDDDFAWTANTPTDFTIKNGWVLRLGSMRRLKNGGIKTVYGTDIIGQYEVSGGTNFVEADIGKTVRNTDQAVNFGELVDFDNTKGLILVRLSGGQHDAVNAEVLQVTTDGGTGTRTSNGVEAFGDDQWSNINTIGDLVGGNTNPLMYVFTGNLTTGDDLGVARKNKSWEDDPDEELTNADRGVLDALIRIIYAGTTLGNPAGEIHVYARTGLDTGSDFAIDVSAGGRIAVPISNSNDVEDTLGDYCFVIDGQSAQDFTVGEEITENTATPVWKAEVVEYIEGVDNATSVLIVRGLTALITDGEGLTGTSSGATATVRGTAGGQLFTYDVAGDPIVEGDYGVELSVSGGSAWQGVIRGHLTIAEGGATVGYVVAESNHDVEAEGNYYASLLNDEVVTGTGISVTVDTARAVNRLCSDLDDVRIKAQYWDLTVASQGDAVVGDNIIQATSNAEGTILAIPDGTSLFVSSNNGIDFDASNTVTDADGGTLSVTPSSADRDELFGFEFPLQTTGSFYNILIDGGARSNAEIYHYIKFFQQANSSNVFPTSDDQQKELYLLKEELGGATLISQLTQGEEYFRAFADEDTPANSYTAQDPKSRLAVKNGSTLVSGQGVAIINLSSSDVNNVTLTNSAGAQNSPFTSATVDITSTISGDHVQVALDDGSGQEQKAQFTSGVGNNAGDADFVVTGALPNDTPTGASGGVIKVIDISSTETENKEMRYRYTSYTGSTLTLVADAGVGTETTGDAGGTILTDTAANFTSTDTVQVGDPIENTTTNDIAWVKVITDSTHLVTTKLTGGGDNEWGSGDGYQINLLNQTYVSASDTAYIPYIDRVADATNEDETLTFVTDRNVVIRVRNTSIIDFDTTGTIGSGGLSVKTVRNPDTVYAP